MGHVHAHTGHAGAHFAVRLVDHHGHTELAVGTLGAVDPCWRGAVDDHIEDCDVLHCEVERARGDGDVATEDARVGVCQVLWEGVGDGLTRVCKVRLGHCVVLDCVSVAVGFVRGWNGYLWVELKLDNRARRCVHFFGPVSELPIERANLHDLDHLHHAALIG